MIIFLKVRYQNKINWQSVCETELRIKQASCCSDGNLPPGWCLLLWGVSGPHRYSEIQNKTIVPRTSKWRWHEVMITWCSFNWISREQNEVKVYIQCWEGEDVEEAEEQVQGATWPRADQEQQLACLLSMCEWSPFAWKELQMCLSCVSFIHVIGGQVVSCV